MSKREKTTERGRERQTDSDRDRDKDRDRERERGGERYRQRKKIDRQRKRKSTYAPSMMGTMRNGIPIPFNQRSYTQCPTSLVHFYS